MADHNCNAYRYRHVQYVALSMVAYLLGNIESRCTVAIIDIHLGKLIDSAGLVTLGRKLDKKKIGLN